MQKNKGEKGFYADRAKNSMQLFCHKICLRSEKSIFTICFKPLRLLLPFPAY